MNTVYTAPIITPENIIDITIQYRLPTGGSPSNASTIFVRYGLINVQQKRISIQEVKPYISYLQIKAVVEGLNVIATQYTNFKTVISLGNEEGSNAQAALFVAAGDNVCAAIPIIIYIDHIAPFVPGDVIYTDVNLTAPLTGFDFISNVATGIIYTINSVTGVVGAATGDTCIVPAPVANDIVTMKVNGTNFDNTNALTDLINTVITNNHTVHGKQLGYAFTFELPKLTNGQYQFNEEYTWLGVDDNGFTWFDNGATWTIIIFQYYSLGTTTIEFTALEFVAIETPDFQGAGILFGDTHDTNGKVLSFATTYFRRDTGFFFDSVGYLKGLYNIAQYEGATQVQGQIGMGYDQSIVPASVNITRIVITRENIMFRKNGALTGDFFVSASGDFNSGFASINNTFPTPDSTLRKNDSTQVWYNSGLNLAATFNISIDFYQYGVLLWSAPAILDSTNRQIMVDPVAEFYNHIEINIVAAGTGFAIDLQGAAGSPCAAGAVTYFINHGGTIAPGDVVYTDLALTTPLAGFTQIVDPNTGQIYLIDVVTGVVGALTGSSCDFPPKDVWFLNNTGAALVMSTDTDPAINIPTGGALSIPLTPNGYLENDTAGSLKFTFIQTMPATLAPNEAPNPDTLIAGGQHTLDGDLSTLNYCKVEQP